MTNGDDIFLRTVKASDASLLLQWENDHNNWSVSETTTEYSLGDIIALIESLEDVEVSQQARFIIAKKSSGIAVGAVDLFSISFNEESASIGILIAEPKNRNQGVATASLKLLERVCVEELGINNLEAKVYQTNTSSIRLFEKLGFSKKKLKQDGQLDNADYIETIIFKKCLKN